MISLNIWLVSRLRLAMFMADVLIRSGTRLDHTQANHSRQLQRFTQNGE